jgi:heterodisulfide reductase subunit C
MDEPQLTTPNQRLPLRKIVLAETNQDVHRCEGCGSCNFKQQFDDIDISLDCLVQMVLLNDVEVLTTRTLWSDTVLESIQYACRRGLDLRAIFQALRLEAFRQGIREEKLE